MNTHQVTNRFNLMLANLIIEDDEPTIAEAWHPEIELIYKPL